MKKLCTRDFIRIFWKKDFYADIKSFAIRKAILLAVYFVAFSLSPVFANPEDGQISAGSATISSPSTNAVQINQSSDKAIIDWHSFNIAPNEHTHFEQPSTSSITLNRINPSQGVSQIFGQLSANGRIILVNQAGIYFGPNAYVNVGGIIVSTSNITNENFMAGKYIFDQSSSYGGSVINKGTIKAGDSGLVALIGTSVRNDGLIVANVGTVVLASGDKFTFDFSGDQLISFAVDAPATKQGVDSDGNPLADSVSNAGKIIANGGKIIMTAKSVNGVLNSTINMSGVLVANSVKQKNGVIILSADNGTIRVTGKIHSTGTHYAQKGGEVKILGKNVILADNANIDVSGNVGGGEILIGGDYQGKNLTILNAENTFVGSNVKMYADALRSGDGGKVIVWANNNTQFYGNIFSRGGTQSGNGGFVETSGKENLIFNGFVNTLAPNGKTGTLLLDPRTITVASSGSATLTDVDSFSTTPSIDITIASSTINNAASNVILQANRDIRFNDNVAIIGSGLSLTAQAGRDIILANNISVSTNNGNISFTANDSAADGSNRATGTGDITMNAGSSLNAGSGDINLAIGSSTSSPFNPGSISLRNLSGNNITIDGMNAVTLNNNSSINATGAVTIHANAIGSGGQDFVMNTGSSITTSDTSANAILITINAAGGGTGLATLRDITTGAGGTITVTTDTGGNLTGSNINLTSGTLSGGNVVFSSANKIVLTGAINISGTVDISANTSGSGGQDFTMSSGSSITTLNASANAVNISVNKDLSGTGTGGAFLRDITTGDGGTITVRTNPNGSLSGGDITQTTGTFNVGSGTITLSTPKISGNNIGTSSRNITIIANILNATSGSSGIFIDNLGTSTLQLGTIDTSGTTGSAQIFSNGPIAQAIGGSITVNNLTIQTTNDPGAAITLTNTGNLANTINLQSLDAAGVASADGAINYIDSGALVISGVNTTNTVNITAGDTITQSGAMSGSTLTVKTLNDAGSAITLSNAGNEFDTIDLRTRNAADNANTAGAITYRDATGYDIANISTTSTASLTAAGTITQSGALTITGTPTFTIRSSTYDILLASFVNDFGTTPVFTTAVGGSIQDLAIRNISATAQVPSLPSGLRNLTLIFDNTGITLPSVTLSGNLVATAGGLISQSGALIVNGAGGTSTFSAGIGNNIILTNAANDFATVAITSGNDVSLADINSLDLGTSTVSGNLTVTANGAITQSGTLDVSGSGKSATFSAGAANNITLMGAANNFSSIAFNSGNDININDINSIILGASTISGNLTLTTNGAITQSGALLINGPGKSVTFSAGNSNDITLTNAGNDFTTIGSVSGHNISLVDLNAIDLGTTSASGTLNVTANGDITDSGNLTVANAATFAAGTSNNITLNNNNDFDTVNITSGNNVTLNDINEIDLGSLNINGALSVTTSGNITNSAAVIVSGSTTLNSNSNDITLNNASNNFSTVSITNANNVSLTDVNSLIIGASTVGGNFTVNSSGAITQTGVIVANGAGKIATFSAGSSNNITLSNVNNDFTTVAIGSANDVTLADTNAIKLGASTISGNFMLTSTGDITQSGAIIANGVNKITTLDAGSLGAITLNNASNDFTTLKITNAQSASLRDLNDLTLDANTVIQNFTAIAGGDLTTSGLIQTNGGNVSLSTTGSGIITIGSSGIKTSFNGISNGGSISITAANTNVVNPAIIVNGLLDTSGGSGGTLTIGGSVQLNQAPTIGAGNVTLRGNGTSTILGTINFTSDTTISTVDADIIINGAVTSDPGFFLSFLSDTNNDGSGGVRVTTIGSVNSGGNLTLSGSDLFVNPGVAIELQSGSSLQAAGTISLLGNVGNSDILINGGIQSNVSNKDITVNAAGTGITQLGANITSTGGAIILNDNINLVANSTLTSNGGTINIANAINGIGKTLTLSAGSGTDISLTNASNNFGTVAITSGKNVVLVDSHEIDLGTSTISGTLNVISGGNITDSGTLNVSGIATFNAGSNNIILDTSANNFSTVSIGNGKDVTLADTNSIILGTSSITGLFNITAGGDITDSGALSIGSIATLNAGIHNITLDNANDFDRVRISAANDVVLNDINAIKLGISTISGTLNVTAAGNITNTGALVVTGISTFNAGANNITLDQNNDFSIIKVSSATNATINDINSLDLGASSITGALSVTTAGNITNNNGALAVTGITTLNPGNTHNITFNNASNNFGTVTVNSGNNVSITDSNALILGPSTISGTLSATAGSHITQSGALAIIGIPTFTVTGANTDILLSSAANIFSATPIITNNGNIRDLSLRNISATAQVPTLPSGMRNLTLVFNNAAIALPALTLTGNATLTSNNLISQSGAASIAGTLTATAIGGINLTNVSNTIGGFNATNTVSGAVQLVSTASPLIITGINQSGGGGITLTNTGTLSVANGATISAVSSNTIITATDLDLGTSGAINTGTGNLTIKQNTNNGSVALGNGAGTMSISASELGRISANNLTITAPINGQIVVDGISSNNVSNINGTVSLTAAAATGTLGNIIFQGSASIFKNLTAFANNGITINAPLSTTVGNLTLDADVNKTAATSDKLALNNNISSAGNITLNAKNGGIVLGASITVSGNNITFNDKLEGAYNLTLNAGSTGNIGFITDVGSVARLGNVTITNANNITNNAIFNAVNFIQQSGAGTTDFGSVGINLTNNATITTNAVNGDVNVTGLSLNTNFANLNGFVNGLSGQAAINNITLLNAISSGTHFFDGIDMYSSPTPPTPPVPPVPPTPNPNISPFLLGEIPQITFSYLYSLPLARLNTNDIDVAPLALNYVDLLEELDSGTRKCVSLGGNIEVCARAQ